MEEAKSRWQQPRSWIGLIVIVILVIFLLFYRPFEQYLLEGLMRKRRASGIISVALESGPTQIGAG